MIKTKHFTESVYQAFGVTDLSSKEAKEPANQHLARVRELSRYKFVFQVGGMWLIYYRSRFAGVLVPEAHIAMHQGHGDIQDAKAAFVAQREKLREKYVGGLAVYESRIAEREARKVESPTSKKSRRDRAAVPA